MVSNRQGYSQTEASHDKYLGAKLSCPFEFPNGRLLKMNVLRFMGGSMWCRNRAARRWAP
jgi:hypothetical protein